MTNRDNLPAKRRPSSTVVSTAQGGSLVTSGLAAIQDLQAQQVSLSPEANAERLFKLGMRLRYGEDGAQTDYEEARRYFSEASNLNHAEAQFELSELAAENAEQDEAARWLRRSAKLGFGPALSALSDDPGLSQEQHDDYVLKARAWYLTRATAGDAEWQFEYADFLRRAPLYKEDGEEGFRWLKASANQNYKRACSRLGYTYLRGAITEHATQQGIYWLTRAADLGDSFACKDLGNLYLQGHCESDAKKQGVQRRLRVEPDKQRAISWFERSIEMGNRGTAYHLGVHFLKGGLLDRNLQLAEKWLLRSANDGYDSAQVLLGTEYASGTRFRQDTDAALHWLTLATKNLTSTCVKIAEIYLEGAIVPRNFDEAIAWLDGATEGEFFRNRAMKLVSDKCFDGRFSATQESAAQAWLAKMAALTVESVADMKAPQVEHRALHLAELYELGLGVKQDFEKAIYWYKQSATLGLYGAQRRLRELEIDWKHV